MISSRGGELTGLDTNVVLRAMLLDDEKQSEAAVSLLRSLTRECPGFITQITLAEVYWVLSRSMRIPPDSCLAMMQRLVEIETIEFDDGESVVRALSLAEAGADFADSLIQGAMELFGVTDIVTFDKHAAKHFGWRLLAN